ncbi:muscleblind-like protein 3 isoform X2 [Uloborus diversus]|uniref:muscleblind-like protein 3 isoform X2 n=1 Tax=Uloborus diversus TaxID=327109 RepID=UPI0024091986|nr:muscleblind-like protein 3 isoform X2 [Uloborus diversus]
MASGGIVTSIKDSRWLQLEVCREYQRNKCVRPDTECKFAHPPAPVEVQNGRVIACYDSIKGRCNRDKPPCKYFHPPQHLKDQLLITGRNHLALKNAIFQQVPLAPFMSAQPQTFSPAVLSIMNEHAFQQSNPQLIPAVPATTYNPYLSANPMIASGLVPAEALATPPQLTPVMPTPMMTPKTLRTDRLEVCREFQRGHCKRPESECRFAHPVKPVDSSEGMVTVCMDFVKGRCSRECCKYYHPTPQLQVQLKAQQAASMAYNCVPYSKRAAVEKCGIPVYQPDAMYPQPLTMQVQQPPLMPASFTCLPSAVPGQVTMPRY